MKFRFASVKRPLLALTALAAMIAVTGGVVPAAAVTHNNLSFPGTTGKIRVHSIFQDNLGATKQQVGDTKDPTTNPNRTVGDVPVNVSNQFNTACTPAATDCLRTLAVNDPAVNISAADGHAHYHTGDTKIIVNQVAGFRRGDSVMIGSPYCNHAFLGLTCKKFVPGFGIVDEQPTGEVVQVVGGDIAPGNHGVGVLELGGAGLTNDVCPTPAPLAPCAHLEGTQVYKLPTLYQGQQMRVDIPHADLLDCDILLTTCNPNDVTVTADFLPPQGSHDPAFPRRPLALNRDNPNGPFAAEVPATCGPTPCGAGYFSFFIPKEITGTATIGNTFNVNKTDTWYTVEVKAIDSTDGHLVADGIVRFKLTPAALVELKAENPTRPGVTKFFPTESVEITGAVRDNSSAAALYRPVEDVIVDVAVTKPNGSTRRYQVTSCVNTAPAGATDSCGGNVFRSQPNGHGKFLVTFGGPSGLHLGSNPTCNPSSITTCLSRVVNGMLDTSDTGTYDVLATLRGYRPTVSASTTFDVAIF
ncbi:MAG TPA: hypothetical protein VM841_07445 [Actinomycetota bacterium]|nr:hypothetical protein [Actinomycetota bacterium]